MCAASERRGVDRMNAGEAPILEDGLTRLLMRPKRLNQGPDEIT